jgi:2-isopropylmalate synthase
MELAMEGQVRIFDTTLRDGEQSPGATMTSAEKLEVARALARLRVDVIEAGFPAASPDDLAAVRSIAELVGTRPAPGSGVAAPPIICALARAAKKDIAAAWEGVKIAARPRIHTFLATSDLHMEHKLRMSRDEVLARVSEMVAHARSFCEDVEFSPEDAGRSDPEFLYRVLEAAIRAGATTLNIPDTVGYTTPDELGALITGIRESVPGAKDVILSVHCHDDLGLATANTLAGVLAGARQVEVTVNGIGERAGNASLEEVVMAIHTRAAKFGLTTGVDTTQLTRASRIVSTSTGFAVPPNKAVVGANAFAHESGIHQDGMLKHQQTYEIMRPETVGATQTRLVLGKHSGRAALASRLADLGIPLSGEALDRMFSRFKAIAERRKYVTDTDLEVLVADERPAAPDAFTLDGFQAGCGTMGMPTATVRLRCPDGQVRVHAAVGTGPVDAAYKAIDAISGAPVQLVEFAVHAVTEGIDALGHVTVRIREESERPSLTAQHDEPQARIFFGEGADTDIIVAGAKAYLRAINRMFAARLDTEEAWQPPPRSEAAPTQATAAEKAS